MVVTKNCVSCDTEWRNTQVAEIANRICFKYLIIVMRKQHT